jgi:hypothetical protein
MAYGGSGRRDRYQSRQNLNAEAWCSTHQRYYRTHMKMGCRVVPTGGCPQCGSSLRDDLLESRKTQHLP